MKFSRIPRFDKSLRQLKKRYPRIDTDLVPVFGQLETDQGTGVVIPDDFDIRKVRVASSDMQRGKSGGFRLLYKLVDAGEPTIVLLFIYAKTDQSDVAATFLESLNEEMESSEDEEE